jgi:hypothetical protein
MNMRTIGAFALGVMLVAASACSSPTGSRLPRSDDGKPNPVDPPGTAHLQISPAASPLAFA